MSKLSNVIPIRFTDEERQALKDRARLSGETPSAIARNAIRHFLANVQTEKPPIAS